MRAYCAVATTPNRGVGLVQEFADACLEAFDERFPEQKTGMRIEEVSIRRLANEILSANEVYGTGETPPLYDVVRLLVVEVMRLQKEKE